MSATESSPIAVRWYFTVALVLVLFLIVGIYSSNMANNNTSGYDEQQAKIRKTKLDKMQDTDRKTLGTADWIDKDKGTVRIPIDEAMSQEVIVLKDKAPAAGGVIPGSAPLTMNTVPATNAAPATNTAPSATNAPAASGTPPASNKAPAASTNAAPAAATPPKK